MNAQLLALIQEILTLAGGIISGLIPGSATDINIAESLLTIVQKGISAYEAQTGQPIDPTLLKPFTPIT